MGEPPSDDGTVQETVACPGPATAVTDDGADGTPIGTTALDDPDGALVPPAFVAVTRHV